MTEREAAVRVRLALCKALAHLELMEDGALLLAEKLNAVRALLESPEVNEALRTVVTRDGAVLAKAIESARVELREQK